MDDTTLWRDDIAEPNQNSITEKDYSFTAIGGLNTVRLVVKMDYFIDKNNNPNEKGFEFLNKQLSHAEKNNLHLIIDMHMPNGGAIQDYKKTEKNSFFWSNQKLQDSFIKGWRLIAERYKNDKRIFAFELMNEPAVEPNIYWDLMNRTIKAIRSIDKNHWIIVQLDIRGEARSIDDSKTILSAHFYDPILFTHQNVIWDDLYKTNERIEYPGIIKLKNGTLVEYNKDKLKKFFDYYSTISKRLNHPLIIGEFAVSTFADEKSIANWISDVTKLVEETGLGGYLYWRQIDLGKENLKEMTNATMAIINKGDYYSPAQFFGIRPGFENISPEFNAQKFYQNAK